MTTAILLPHTTPSDYHRIVSQKLAVPSDPKVSIPVGILAWDPLLKSLDTTVVSCTVVHPAVVQGKTKPAKKAVSAPTLPEEPILQVQLHDTVIFPEGGGQPTDIGTLSVKADGTSWQVLQAKRHGGHAVHYIRVQSGDVDAAIKAFVPGAEVTVALGAQGYERRYDHMSMHTSQHLLSALLETRLNVPTLSWALTTYPSPCYVEVPRGMNAEEILAIQNEANRLVFEGRKVHVEVDELVLDSKEVQRTESGRAIGKALPEDYTGGVKRVVVIDGVDRNPCCGTHLPSIHNLQLFLFPHTESLSRSSTTNARLYFLAGPRLITYLTSTHSIVSQAALTLSCGPPLLPERLNQVVEERKRVEKRVSDLEPELAVHIAEALLAKQTSSKSTQGSIVVSHLHRTDDGANSLVFLSAIASAIAVQAEEHIPSQPYVFVLSSSPSTQTQSSLSTVFVVGTDDGIVKHVGEGLKNKLGIKGGGKGSKWSGKYIGVWKAAKENAAIADILDGVQRM